MDTLTKQYTSSEVAVAAGIEHKAVQNWTTRGLITGHSGGGGRGRARYFSWSNVMEVAIAAELMRLGVSAPQDAFTVGAIFSHTGDGRTGYRDANNPVRTAFRELGLPYHIREGETYLFAAGGKSIVELAGKEDPSLTLISRRLDDAASFVVLNLTTLFFDVAKRLEIDPLRALDATYPEYAG